jgi:integrase
MVHAMVHRNVAPLENPEPALKITSDLSVRKAPRGEHTVHGAKGLLLRVHAAADGSATRGWIVRLNDGGKRRRIGLGTYPLISLAHARQDAQDAHRAISKGEDPSQTAKRRQRAVEEARILPLGKAIDDYLAKAASRFRNSKSDEIRRRALLVLFAPLHAKDVAKITPADIADVLRLLKPETASRAYTAIRAVFDYAEVVLLPYGVTISNPANTRSLAALGWKRNSRKNHVPQPAVHYEHVPEVVSELRALDCDDVRCLLLIIATGLRCGTVRAAKWADIDFTKRLWRVPPADLKTGKDRDEPFRVPLNNLAVDVLETMRERSSSRFVFANSSGAPIGDGAITNLLRRLRRRHDQWRDPNTKKPFTAHGFRASLKTWSREARLDPKLFGHIPPREIVEIILDHETGLEIERIYDRSDLLDAQRTMLDLWARHCAGGPADVLQLSARA